MLGIPIILTAFGEAAALPLFLVLAFHGLLIFSTGILLMELSTSSSRSLRGAISALPQALSNQTVLIALLAGVVWNMSGLNLPARRTNFCIFWGRPPFLLHWWRLVEPWPPYRCAAASVWRLTCLVSPCGATGCYFCCGKFCIWIAAALGRHDHAFVCHADRRADIRFGRTISLCAARPPARSWCLALRA